MRFFCLWVLVASLLINQISCYEIIFGISPKDFELEVYAGVINEGSGPSIQFAVMDTPTAERDAIIDVPAGTDDFAKPSITYPGYTIFYNGMERTLTSVLVESNTWYCDVSTVFKPSAALVFYQCKYNGSQTTATTTTTTTATTTTTTTTTKALSTTTTTSTTTTSTTTTVVPTTTTTKTSTTATTALPTNCTSGIKGKKSGDGYNGDCCSSSDDCINACVKGVCNGPKKPISPPAKCIKGQEGKKQGKGTKNYCCVKQ